MVQNRDRERACDAFGGNMHIPLRMPAKRWLPAVCPCFASAALVFCFSARADAQTLGNVSGTVTDTAGIPLLGAEITVDAASVRSFTDEQGVFHLGGVPYGARTLTARRLGFASVQTNVDVSPVGEATVSIRLKPIAAPLPPIVIRPSRMSYTGRLAGYYERLEKRTGGVFITRDQIDREQPRML